MLLAMVVGHYTRAVWLNSKYVVAALVYTPPPEHEPLISVCHSQKGFLLLLFCICFETKPQL